MSTTRTLLPGVFVGSHAVAEGLLTPTQLRTSGYRRLMQAPPSRPRPTR